MVQGIDENRKTQTRRTKGLEEINTNPDEWKLDGIEISVSIPREKNDYKVYHTFINTKSGEKCSVFCPYNLGDLFWVRETFVQQGLDSNHFTYKASHPLKDLSFRPLGGWKPSLFMPKKACRFFLKIKSIRAERLQDISEEDAIAEGVEKIADYGSTGYRLYTEPEASYTDIDAIYSFESLWQSINGKDSWNLNPFVWVYEFEKIAKPEDFI